MKSDREQLEKLHSIVERMYGHMMDSEEILMEIDRQDLIENYLPSQEALAEFLVILAHALELMPEDEGE